MAGSARRVGVIVALALVAVGCSRAVDVDSVATRSAKNPAWVSEAFALARTEASDVEPLTEGPVSSTSTTTPGGAGLPSKTQFVSALSAAGLDATAAGCIYDSISGTPLATTVANLFTSATNPLQASTLSTSLDQATQKQLLVALAPCLDTKTLLALLASLSGISPSSLVAAGLGGSSTATTIPNLSAIESLVASVAKQSSGIPAGLDAIALAKAAGINLTPAQLAELPSLIATAEQLESSDSSAIDFTKINFSQLSQQQILDLFTALVKGLTPAQLGQLDQVAGIDLQNLNINIDPANLTHDQIGSLFAILLPFIAAGIEAPTGQPPAGIDPSQIYIPPGTDLSAINPLNFIPETDVVAGLVKQGLSPGMSACLYERVRLIDPRLLGAAYQGSNLTGAGELLLSVLSCLGK